MAIWTALIVATVVAAAAIGEPHEARSCSALWYQCGGEGWTGSTCCESGSACVYSNEWYSQCLPSSDSSSSSSSTTTKTTTTTSSTTTSTTSSASGIRTAAPSGCMTVRASGASSNEYSSLGDAVSALGSGSSSSTACIFVYPGTYSEQVVISEYEGALTIYGYTTDISSYVNNQVTITHSENSTVAGSDEKSSTVDVKVDNFKMYNINIVNSFGAGTQAIAFTSNGNQQSFYGCGFYGYQDTLYAHSGYQYYKNCLIQGAVDYIFGDASAWFEQCTIQSNGNGAITAMHRDTTSEATWYVINKSTIEAASGYSSTGNVYLGRPWGVDARVIFQYCSLSNIINSKGWTTMAEGATPTFMEYGNTGAGATTTARVYESTATTAVSLSELFPSGTAWIDSTY